MFLAKPLLFFVCFGLIEAGCNQKIGNDTQTETVISRSNQFVGEAVKIVDGDTFDLLIGNKTLKRIRLFGIDCPERGQPFYRAAKEQLGRLITGKRIHVHIVNTDRYKRLVGIAVTDEGTNINESLLKMGLSWHYTHYDRNPAWSKLERQARQAKLGIWSDAHPIAPWVWKH